MGNEQIKQELRKVTELDFSNKELEPFEAKLWTFEDQEDFQYSSLGHSIVDISDHSLRQQFPTQCSIKEDDNHAVAKARLDFDADRVVSAGFTTAEKKVDTLRQDGKSLTRVLPPYHELYPPKFLSSLSLSRAYLSKPISRHLY